MMRNSSLGVRRSYAAPKPLSPRTAPGSRSSNVPLDSVVMRRFCKLLDHNLNELKDSRLSTNLHFNPEARTLAYANIMLLTCKIIGCFFGFVSMHAYILDCVLLIKHSVCLRTGVYVLYFLLSPIRLPFALRKSGCMTH